MHSSETQLESHMVQARCLLASTCIAHAIASVYADAPSALICGVGGGGGGGDFVVSNIRLVVQADGVVAAAQAVIHLLLKVIHLPSAPTPG